MLCTRLTGLGTRLHDMRLVRRLVLMAVLLLQSSLNSMRRLIL